jgi:hypothetical protein
MAEKEQESANIMKTMFILNKYQLQDCIYDWVILEKVTEIVFVHIIKWTYLHVVQILFVRCKHKALALIYVQCVAPHSCRQHMNSVYCTAFHTDGFMISTFSETDNAIHFVFFCSHAYSYIYIMKISLLSCNIAKFDICSSYITSHTKSTLPARWMGERSERHL